MAKTKDDFMMKLNTAGIGALMLALATTACVTDPTTGKKHISKAAICWAIWSAANAIGPRRS
jgi:hypothetical protein